MHPQALFISGIGTGIGKTVVSAVVAQALEADYWKPVQSGIEGTSDSDFIRQWVHHKDLRVHPESYRLRTPASPDLAASIDGVEILPERILRDFRAVADPGRLLVIEGAGGLMVPLNPDFLMLDLIRMMEIPLLLVAGQYLGSINHALMTARVLESLDIPVLGWVFNGSYRSNEEDILHWTPFPKIGYLEWVERVDQDRVGLWADRFRPSLRTHMQTLMRPHAPTID